MWGFFFISNGSRGPSLPEPNRRRTARRGVGSGRERSRDDRHRAARTATAERERTDVPTFRHQAGPFPARDRNTPRAPPLNRMNSIRCSSALVPSSSWWVVFSATCGRRDGSPSLRRPRGRLSPRYLGCALGGGRSCPPASATLTDGSRLPSRGPEVVADCNTTPGSAEGVTRSQSSDWSRVSHAMTVCLLVSTERSIYK